MTHPVSSMFYLRSALSLAIGIGSAVTGSYLVSRIKDKQELDARLERMEQIVEKLAAFPEQADAAPSTAPKPQRTAKTAKK
ncbi:hypothetical protein [Geoalkalibacter halelectricus]|uniref:YtxH-like protein n=1 Tax=Geoalkalibacter halelectricus TaxID=2847045 RepID=A0ABY5ZQS5_9BACT|nr:hypothetical protein [Geoalkalibacter halelectricus]MDO3377690.1 hypothetical protein [Geoalkalibacter halelectricus]UWZ81478.1 hypothetical protein L9S41_08800 [Geoalkalibacter halelectricus]